MQLMKLLHKTFQKELPSIHQVRLKNVINASETLIKHNKLTLTALGRNLSNQAKARSNIKKIDRLLSNPSLQTDRLAFYKLMASYLITEGTSPCIHIDWSCICSKTKLYLLRASLTMLGRSIVIYEACYPKKKENNHAIHKLFLNQLKAILPVSVKPIIVTDAGFRAPWFAYIRSMGWDFVGRLRHKNLICLDSESTWQLGQSFHEFVRSKPCYLGHGILTTKQKTPAHFILYKGKKKNRHRVNNSKTYSPSAMHARYARSHQEPWLLATSLSPSTKDAKQVVEIYHQRMRIEENFRDTKCTRYGFGLKESRSRSSERMNILLLIAAIATFACWLSGIFIRQTGAAADYQAHSSKFTSALSNVYLGREALKKNFCIIKKQFTIVLKLLFEIGAATQLESHCHE
jgi:hypothetical protein